VNFTKDNIISRWEEVAGFGFRRLLEDNQIMSLPMMTLIGGKRCLFAFVYSFPTKCSVLVSQRHFWDMTGHKMMLCKETYTMKPFGALDMDQNKYLNLFADLSEVFFADELSSSDSDRVREYMTSFPDPSVLALYLAENKPFAEWAKSHALL